MKSSRTRSDHHRCHAQADCAQLHGKVQQERRIQQEELPPLPLASTSYHLSLSFTSHDHVATPMNLYNESMLMKPISNQTGRSARCHDDDQAVASCRPHPNTSKRTKTQPSSSAKLPTTTKANRDNHLQRSQSSRTLIDHHHDCDSTYEVFVQGVLCPRYIRSNDRVMISIPEDMMIHGLLPANLDGRIGRVVRGVDVEKCEQQQQELLSMDSDQVEIPVEVQFKKLNHNCDAALLSFSLGEKMSRKQRRNDPQSEMTVTVIYQVPIFCLCLPNFVLKERMAQDGLNCIIE